MDPIDHPQTGFREIHWQPLSAVAVTQSIFTFKQQAYRWPGQMRQVTVSLPPLTIPQAKAWKAFFYRLNGREGTFYLSDTLGSKPHGKALGLGVVDGADQTGDTLLTKGWLANQSQLFMAGDMISIDDRIYDILEDVHSDTLGGASLKLWPRVAGALADASSIKTKARGVFRLKDFPEHGWSVNRLAEGIEFSATEVI